MIQEKIHYSFWLISIILTGIITGFMFSHSLLLGPWFTWFITEPGKLPLLYETYSDFTLMRPLTIYNSIFFIQLFSFMVFLMLSIIEKYRLKLALPAFLFSFLVGLVHYISGFGKLEGEVLSGIARDSESLLQFAAINVPIHLFYTVCFLISFVLLCFCFQIKREKD